jgi:hypothetical protein
MGSFFNNRVMTYGAVVTLAFALGYIVADDSSEVVKLRSVIDQSNRFKRTSLGHNDTRMWKNSRSASAVAGATVQPTPEDDLSKVMTSEDWALMRALDERYQKGEYILQFERPAAKKLRDLNIDRMVAQTSSNNAANYEQVFTQLGINSEVSEQLKSHLAKIHKAALETDTSIQQILFARIDYEKRLRSSLSDENYSRYRQFEGSKLAFHEYQNLQSYLQTKHNASIDPRYEQEIVGLIQETEAYTDRSWVGPFDGLPQVAVGPEMVAGQLEQDIKQITANATRFRNRVSQVGLPDDYQSFIEKYYLDKVQTRQRFVERVRNPPDPADLIKELTLRRNSPNQAEFGR